MFPSFKTKTIAVSKDYTISSGLHIVLFSHRLKNYDDPMGRKTGGIRTLLPEIARFEETTINRQTT